MLDILPAILASDETEFRARLALVEDLAPVIHLDIMDGAFVPNTCWADLAVLGRLMTDVRFELHLMVEDPRRYIDQAREIDIVERIIWHVEAPANHTHLIERCSTANKEAGLAVIPRTSLDALASHAGTLAEILIMGSDPGFSGKTLDAANLEKAAEAHRRWPSIPIGFDIGVNEATIPLLQAAGVSRACAASAIFAATDPRDMLLRLQKRASA